jgi:UDP-glucuronate 4-epimerase
MKILVTGGAGFIGSHLSEHLLGKGHQVAVIDDFNDFYPPEIKRDNIRILKKIKEVQVHEKDITNPEDMDRIFGVEKPECVFHLAARAGVRPSLKQPYLYEKVNVVGTLNILECSRKHAVKRVVFGSSSSVYGERDKVPFCEDDLLDNIVSPYAATKAAGEHFCRCYHLLYGMEIIVLRFFTVYGPRQRPEMAICKFARQIDAGSPITLYGDGSTSRDYTYIDDIIQGLARCVDAKEHFGIFNLGESRTVPLNELVRLIERSMGKKARIEFAAPQKGDVSRTYADVSRARSALGYAPKVSIEEGVDRFVSWYREHYTRGEYAAKN